MDKCGTRGNKEEAKEEKLFVLATKEIGENYQESTS